MHLNGKICFADFEVDTAHRLLRRDGQPVPLNAKAFDVLAYLVTNHGRLVTKDEILDAVWENQFVEEANLKVQISALRKALGERKDEHRYLVTLPGRGYKFVGDVRNGSNEIVLEKHKISHVVVEQETEISETMNGRRSRMFSSGRLAVMLGGITVVVVTIGAVLYFLSGSTVWKRSDAAVLAPPDVKTKRLTNNGRVNRVKLSPDGRFFAYTVRQRTSFESEIRIGQTDGSSDVVLRPIVPGQSYYPLSFSSDGNSLYYVQIPAISEYKQPNGVLYKAPILNGVPQRLSDGISVFSILAPDEKHLAVARNSPGRHAIIVSNLDGSDEREIAVRAGDETIDPEAVTWSADGQFIAFTSPAGQSRVDSSKRSFEISVVRVADNDVRQLTSAEWNAIVVLEWLKDGTGLIVAARDKDQYNNSSLWTVNYPSGSVQRLSRDVSRYSWLSVSGDSKSFAVLQAPIETNIWAGERGNIPAAKQITFSTPGRQDGWYGMDWTSDGRIVYAAWIDESMTLWIANGDGENARQLTSIGFRDELPFASADGKFVVFQSNRSGATEIWRMDTDGANLQRLTMTGSNTYPSITPDGVWVVYRHTIDGKSSLWRVPLVGGEPIQITDTNVFIPRVSPDGKMVACGATFDKQVKLAVFPIEGGDAKMLFDVAPTYNFRRNSIVWSPDGTSLLYPDEEGGILVQDLAGGKPRLMEDLPHDQMYAFSWSKDGKRFAFGRSRQVRDVVLFTNFR